MLELRRVDPELADVVLKADKRRDREELPGVVQTQPELRPGRLEVLLGEVDAEDVLEALEGGERQPVLDVLELVLLLPGVDSLDQRWLRRGQSRLQWPE